MEMKKIEVSKDYRRPIDLVPKKITKCKLCKMLFIPIPNTEVNVCNDCKPKIFTK
mgnify:CR=1 FL=1